MAKCRRCHGRGKFSVSREENCGSCGGTGRMMETWCGSCMGRGRVAVNRDQWCSACNGTGRIPDAAGASSNPSREPAKPRKSTWRDKRDARRAEHRRKKEARHRKALEKKYGRTPEVVADTNAAESSNSKVRPAKPPSAPWEGDLRWAMVVGLLVGLFVAGRAYWVDDQSLGVSLMVGGLFGGVAGRFYKALVGITIFVLVIVVLMKVFSLFGWIGGES